MAVRREAPGTFENCRMNKRMVALREHKQGAQGAQLGWPLGLPSLVGEEQGFSCLASGLLMDRVGGGRAEVAESSGLGPEQGQARARARAKAANSLES